MDASQLEQQPERFIQETDGWYEASYLWSIVTMACVTRAVISARRQQQVLFYGQAVDFSEQLRGTERELHSRMLAVPNLSNTSRLPGWVMLHVGMRVRFTTQVLPPWAVQDAVGTVMEIDLSSMDRGILQRGGDAHPVAEVCLKELPLGVYVKLDNCTREFLPPLRCERHAQAGYCKECKDCRSFEGWVLVQPIARIWTFVDPVTRSTLKVQRTQLPLMPAPACPLYSLQGATTDPGMVGHFIMPRRADSDIKWLIVYVLLSRVRSLERLRSIGIDLKISWVAATEVSLSRGAKSLVCCWNTISK